MGIAAALEGCASLMETIPGIGQVRVHSHLRPPVGTQPGCDVSMSNRPVHFNPGQVNAFGLEILVTFTALAASNPGLGEATLMGVFDALPRIEQTEAANTLGGAAIETEWGPVSLGVSETGVHAAATFRIDATLPIEEA